MSYNDETQGNDLSQNVETTHSTTGSRTIKTSYDEQGRSWVEIDCDINELQWSEWMGGYPDTWKRR